MSNRTLILCKSVHHGNTSQVADAMAQVLDAEVIDPDETMFPTAGDYRLLGIGSGIYYGRFHATIRDWAKRLPAGAGEGHRIFIFSTSGLPFLSAAYHAPLRWTLQRKGFKVVDEFACRGHDTFTFLKLIGGINRHHPNETDLQHAREFASKLS